MPGQGPGSKSQWSSVRLIAVGFLGALVLVAAIFFTSGQRLVRETVVTRPVTVLSEAPEAGSVDPLNPILAAPTALDTIQLVVKPPSVVSTTDKAMWASELLRGGDYQQAESLATEVLAHSTLQSFFYPYLAV
jgi:hypothetical protein